MPKAPPCFDLIKSLDKAEKIYFKRYLSQQATKGEPAVYLKLFNELEKMNDYNKERLKRKFKAEKFVRHLPVSLNYLYGLLLNSLVNYRTKKDDILMANEMLGEVRILFQKHLYKQCGRHIRRTRKFFEEREYQQYLHLLASYEYNLTLRLMQQKETDELQKITEKRRFYLQRMNDELSIFDICDQLTRYTREKILNPNRVFTKETADITYRLKELKTGFETGTTAFKLFYIRANKSLYYIKNQPIKSLRAGHRYVRLRRNLPKNLRYSHAADISAVGNHITKSIEMWFADEAEYWLPELEKLGTQARNLSYQVDLMNWHFRFQILLLRGQFDEMTNWASELMNGLDILLKKNISLYCVLIFESLALYHFLTGNFQESLEWIDRIFEQKGTDEWIREFAVNMRLLEIMVHFNLKNYVLIPSLCLRFERFTKKLQHTENEFIEEIKWVKKMKRLKNYILPRQINDFIEILLPEGYFATPPNFRIVLISVWGQTHINNISLSESWAQHTENILSEMKSSAEMKRLCFAETKTKHVLKK